MWLTLPSKSETYAELKAISLILYSVLDNFWRKKTLKVLRQGDITTTLYTLYTNNILKQKKVINYC